ncbi:DUF5067 domain-containing protein [Anaerostipes caccae]|uniref:DUF5067 domain-containing protein n=1 Tax=Anaerostipes caccae TaxID=105841 RepID=UPI0038D3ACFB
MGKKVLLGCLAIISVISLTACGNTNKDNAGNKTETVKVKKQEAKVPSFTNDILRIEDAEIKIKKIETAKPNTEMGETEPTLIITFSFRNKKEEPLDAMTTWIACFTATQDGGDTIDELDVAMAPQAQKYKKLNENTQANLKPGKTINAVISYNIKYNDKPVTLKAIQGTSGKDLGKKVINLK